MLLKSEKRNRYLSAREGYDTKFNNLLQRLRAQNNRQKIDLLWKDLRTIPYRKKFSDTIFALNFEERDFHRSITLVSWCGHYGVVHSMSWADIARGSPFPSRSPVGLNSEFSFWWSPPGVMAKVLDYEIVAYEFQFQFTFRLVSLGKTWISVSS